ncbi:MAG: ParB/RepB/Spo0J family partition protein [Balneolales bacterium]
MFISSQHQTQSFVRRMRRVLSIGKNTRIVRSLRLDLLLHYLQFHGAWQIKALPDDIGDLVPQVFTVKTTDIRYGGWPPIAHRKSGFMVLDGAWDVCSKVPIETFMDTNVFCRSIREIYIEGKNYKETAQYREMVENMHSGSPQRNCTSYQNIDDYFENLHNVYLTISKEGYKSQSELGTDTPLHEIMVYIDRNGVLQKQKGDGHHRLAIARMLNIEKIPVCILGVHSQWAESCKQKYGGDVVSAIICGMQEEIATV